MKDHKKGSWYLVTGLVIGLAAGLVYAWLVQPVRYYDASPASLDQAEKDQYRSMIAVAYTANQDLVRAKARLELLQDENIAQVLAEQAQRMLAADNQSQEARALGVLALAYGQSQDPATSLTSQPLETPVSPTEKTTEPFNLTRREKICEPRPAVPLFQIQILSEAGLPVPGVPVTITWETGEEQVITGAKASQSQGYTDFAPTPGVLYALHIGEGGVTLTGVSAADCQNSSGETYWGTWSFIFVQP